MGTTKHDPRLKQVLAFLALTFGFSWGIFAIAYEKGLFRHGVGIEELPTLAAFMAGPAIAALVLTILNRRNSGIVQTLGLHIRPNRWWILAWGLPIILCFGAALVSKLAGVHLQGPVAAGDALARVREQLGRRSPIPLSVHGAKLFYASVIAAATFGSFANMFATLTEELGWRGYLWSKLRPIGFWKSNGLIGIVWGGWHAPAIYAGYNYPGERWRGVLMMVLFCVSMAPVIGLMRERGKSVLAASLFHGTLNNVAGISTMLLVNAPAFWNGAAGWGGLILVLITDAIIFLRYQPGSYLLPNSYPQESAV